MSFLGLLILLTALWTPLAAEYSSPTLHPFLTSTITHNLDDIQVVTSTFYNNITVFTTLTEYLTGKQGRQSVDNFVRVTPFTVTMTTLDVITVRIPKLETKVVPVYVTTTIVHMSTITVTVQMDLVAKQTSVVQKLAYQDLYQSYTTVITGTKTIPTCTTEVTVDASTPRGVTSTVDILVTSTASTTLYTTSDFTTTTTVTLDPGSEFCGKSAHEVRESDEL